MDEGLSTLSEETQQDNDLFVSNLPISERNQRKKLRIGIILSLIFTVVAVAYSAVYIVRSIQNSGNINLSRETIPATSVEVPVTSNSTATAKIPINSNKGTVYFISNGKVYSFDEDTSEVNEVLDENNISQISVDHQNNRLYYLVTGDIWNYDIIEKRSTRITNIPGKVEKFVVSPTKDRILYYYITSYVACCGNTEATMPVTTLYVIKTDGTGTFKVNYPPEVKEDEYVYPRAMLESWYPDGRKILLRGHGLLDTTPNFWEVDLSKNTIKKFDIYGDYRVDYMPEVYFSPTGEKLVFIDPNSDSLWLISMDGSDKKVLSPQYFIWIAWSPDGQKISGTATINGNNEMLVLGTEGSILYQSELQNKDEVYVGPSWSKDSRFVIAARAYPYDRIAGKSRAYTFTIFDVLQKTKVELDPEDFETELGVEYTNAVLAPSNRVYFVKNYKNGDKVSRSEFWYFDLTNGEMEKVQDTGSDYLQVSF